MKAFSQHFAFEFKAGLRNPGLLLMNYLFPLVFFTLMGIVMTQINPLFAGSMVPAMVIFAALASEVLGLPGPIVESREAGIYRSYKINGIPARSILGVPVLTTAFHFLIAAAIITFSGPLLFKGVPPTHWGAYALLTLLVAFSYSAIGALIGVVADNSRTVLLLSQLIFLPSMLLGGLMLPLDLLPSSIRPLSSLLPATHAMQAYQGLAYGRQTVLDPRVSVLVLLTGGILAGGLAVYLFNWDSKNRARRGHPLLALLAVAPYLIGAIVAR